MTILLATAGPGPDCYVVREDPKSPQGNPDTSGNDPDPFHTRLFRNLSILFGLLAVLSALLGLIGMHFGITLISSVYPGYRTIALSAALIWMLLGAILTINAARPFRGIPALAAKIVLAVIAIFEAIELLFSLTGVHTGIETWLTSSGTTLLGPSSTPISPVASVLLLLSAVSLFFVIEHPGGSLLNPTVRDGIGITGLVATVASFTFILSYVFGDPLLFGTQIIPIAAISAVAGFFLGAGLIAASGPAALPLRYLTGNSTRARMLRIFVPLIIFLLVAENLAFFLISSIYKVNGALQLSVSIVLFAIITGYVVSRVSMGLGSALDRAELELVQKNEELNALNEELTASAEELRQSNEDLLRNETALRQSELFARNVLNNLFTFVAVTTPGGVLIDVNRAPLEAADLSADECMNRLFWDCYWWSFDPAVQEKIQAACRMAAAGEVSRFDVQARMAGGTLIWFDFQIAPLRDETGCITHLIPSATDITARRLAEQALLENEERLRLALDVSRMGTWDLDLVRHTAHRTLRHDQIFGYDELLPEWTYEMFLDHVLPEDREDVDRKFKAAQQNREEWAFACRIRRKDGALRWIQVWGRGEYDDGRNPVRMIGIVLDITDQRDSEESLHDAHLRLTHHIDNSPLAVVEFDAEFRITRWSNEAMKMFGWTAAEVMGKAIGEFHWVCEKDADRVSAISYDMVSGKAPRNMHANRNYRKDGTVIHCEWYNSAIRDDSGKLVSILSQVLDVTERNRAEKDLFRKNVELTEVNEELTATQEELQQNFDQLTTMEHQLREASLYLENLILYANAPIIVWDKDLRITRFNRAFELLTGRKAHDVIGHRIEQLFPRKYVYEAMDLIRRTMTGERLDVVEIPILHQSGDVRIVLWNSATIYEPDGKTVLSTIAQGQDITRRKLAEEMNLRAREEWERTFNTVPDLIALLDPSHRIVRVNRAMADRLGVTPEECVGRICYEVVHGTLLPPAFCPHAMTCCDGKQHVTEVHEPALGGYFIVSTTPLCDAEGNLTGSVHVAHDITERRDAEKTLELNHAELNAAFEELTATQGELQHKIEELSTREFELNEALAEKDVLLSEIHHRVKNNLTAFISLLSLEGSYEDTPSGRALKQDLQNRARSMALIHETLYRTKKYSSVDMGVYLGTLAEQVAASYASEKHVRTLVDAEGVITDLARATPCGLIVNELITNSFKYAFPESFDCEKERGMPCTIRISLRKDDGIYVLKVADNGIGLPEGVDIAATKSLGLKLVNFLAKHQLRANIDIVRGKGSEYIFRFP
jgi:PAS domain S-box-containing protein